MKGKTMKRINQGSDPQMSSKTKKFTDQNKNNNRTTQMKIHLATAAMNRKFLLLIFATWTWGTVMAQEAQGDAAGKAMPDSIDTIGANAIFTNLRPTPLINYTTVGGRDVLGPANSLGLPQQWAAIAFVPRVSSRVKTLKAAIQWISGTKRIKLGVYNDVQGVPGTPLLGGQGATTNIPTYPSCCALAEVTLPGRGPLVAAGKRYWLVATTDNALAGNFTGKWLNANTASNADKTGTSGWTSLDLSWGAGEVDGNNDNSCPSPCPGGTGTCVGNGDDYECMSAAGLEDLLNLGENNEWVALYPTNQFTIDNVREMFARPYLTVTVRDDGAIQIVNANHKR
jgi:hypothetical protein